MIAVNFTTLRSKLKDYFDQVTDHGETVIVTRKEDKNLVIMSLEKYNKLTRLSRLLEYYDSMEKMLLEAKSLKQPEAAEVKEDE